MRVERKVLNPDFKEREDAESFEKTVRCIYLLYRPFSKMAAENLNKSKLKMNTSTRKSTLTLVTLPSFSISG